MKKNEGKADRTIRAVLGVVFIYLGITLHWGFYIIAAIALITAITGFCGLYHLLKISTAKKK